MKVCKNASGFYDGLKQMHQDCMKVGKTSASAVYEGPSNASGFDEGLKALHPDFTKV